MIQRSRVDLEPPVHAQGQHDSRGAMGWELFRVGGPDVIKAAYTAARAQASIAMAYPLTARPSPAAAGEQDPWPCRAGTMALMPGPRWCDSERVKRWWPHRAAAAREQLIAELERAVPLDVAARACCCPARPVVTVVMPPTPSRPHPVELLLCGHHFRVSQASLRAAGADVYDKAGLLIMTGTGTADTSRPGAGRLVGTAHGHRD